MTRHERNAARRWVGVVLMLLGGHMTLMVVAVTIAVRNHSSAGVTPDYYQQAVQWDDHREAVDRAKQLGWRVKVTPDIWIDGQGQRRLTVSVCDAQGLPCSDLAVEVKVFPARYPDQTYLAEAQEEQPGQYAARLPMTQAGDWQVVVRTDDGQGVCEFRVTQGVANVTAAPESKAVSG